MLGSVGGGIFPLGTLLRRLLLVLALMLTMQQLDIMLVLKSGTQRRMITYSCIWIWLNLCRLCQLAIVPQPEISEADVCRSAVCRFEFIEDCRSDVLSRNWNVPFFCLGVWFVALGVWVCLFVACLIPGPCAFLSCSKKNHHQLSKATFVY